MANDARKAAPIRSRLARVLGLHTNERAWRKGAEGEELVAARLKRLPDTWRVFQDITIDKAQHNVDHLVIGPGGVFSLNTKNLTGSVWVGALAVRVNHQPTDFLRKARWEKREVTRRLNAASGFRVEVNPVIVVIADQLKVHTQPPDVTVVARRKIVQWLVAQEHCLDPSEVQRLAECVEWRSTWQ